MGLLFPVPVAAGSHEDRRGFRGCTQRSGGIQHPATSKRHASWRSYLWIQNSSSGLVAGNCQIYLGQNSASRGALRNVVVTGNPGIWKCLVSKYFTFSTGQGKTTVFKRKARGIGFSMKGRKEDYYDFLECKFFLDEDDRNT